MRHEHTTAIPSMRTRDAVPEGTPPGSLIPRWGPGLALALLLAGCAQQATPSTPQLYTVENVDSGPDSTHMVFNRIGSLNAPPAVGVHNRGTLRIRNTSSAALHVTGLAVTGSWTVSPMPTLPAEVPAGGSLAVPVTFQGALPLTSATTVMAGILTITSDDPAMPSLPVTLSGVWQAYPERDPAGGYTEPTLQQLHDAMGWTFALNTAADAAPLSGIDNGSSVPINQHGWVHAQGDEVLSGYWQAADPAQPVTVQQVAGWSSGEVSTLSWHARGTTTLSRVLTRSASDYQTLFPHQSGSATQLAQGSFTPGGAFGLNVNGYEYSDPTLNTQTKDQANGCPGPCGQHLRFWPLKVAGGQSEPGAYVVGVDYQSLNYDYQDEVYVIRNVTPATP